MNDEKEKIVSLLKSIDEKLDSLIILTKLSIPKQNPTKEEKKIFDLCNMKNTMADMIAKTHKNKGNVAFILNSLRNKALINSVVITDAKTRKKKTVYSKS